MSSVSQPLDKKTQQSLAREERAKRRSRSPTSHLSLLLLRVVVNSVLLSVTLLADLLRNPILFDFLPTSGDILVLLPPTWLPLPLLAQLRPLKPYSLNLFPSLFQLLVLGPPRFLCEKTPLPLVLAPIPLLITHGPALILAADLGPADTLLLTESLRERRVPTEKDRTTGPHRLPMVMMVMDREVTIQVMTVVMGQTMNSTIFLTP